MEKEVITLCEKNQDEKLVQVLTDVQSDKILSLLEHRLSRGRDPAPLVKALFLGLLDSTSSGRKRRQELFKQCVKVLQTNDLNSKQSIDLLGQLMLEVDSLQGVFLAELAELYVDCIKTKTTNDGKYLELLPKILSALAEQEVVSFRGNEMKGGECKNHVINSLCSVRWDSGRVLALVAMFRDVTLTVDELKFVMEKVIRMFPDVSLDELPPLIFQLLLLANKGHKDLLLDGIISYFTELDANQPQEEHSEDMYSELTTDRANRELVLQTEGTVILHVTFSAGQDRQLAREFLKYLKTCGHHLFSSFTFSLALSISKIDYCEETIFDCLKKSIVKNYKDDEKRKESFWVREMVTDDLNVTDSIMAAVRQSTCVWDYVVQGLVKLGLVLLSSFGPRAAFGRVTEKKAAHRTPSQQACHLGAQILAETFKIHSMARDEILDQLLRKIMIGQDGGCISHYMDLLTSTIQATPHHFFDSLTKIREVLDTIPCLPLHAAEGVMRALPPLLKISRHLKDSFLIVLRKSLFSRQLETRRVAVCGYLVLLRHFKVLGGGVTASQHSQSSSSFSGSQLSVDVHRPSTMNAASNEGLCLEILNNLRRSLSQHVQVRQALYQGLHDVTSRNTQLLEPVMEFLTSHLERYYDADDDVTPPLKLNPCVAPGDTVQLNEPLDVLLHTLQLCLHQYHSDPEQEQLSVADKLETICQSLVRRMLKAEMEDFELDKSADYNSATSVGQRNSTLAQLVMGVYEALIEYCLMNKEESVENLETVGKLYDQYKTICDVIREKSVAAPGGGGKKGRPAQASSKLPNKCLLSMECLQLLLKHLIENTEDADSPWSTLRKDDDFRRYVMTSSSQKLRHLVEHGHPSHSDRQTLKQVFTHVSNVSGYLLQEVTSCLQEGGKKKFVASYLEGLSNCVGYVVTFVPHRLEEFVTLIDPGKKTASEGREKIFIVIKRLQALMTRVLSVEEKNLKDCQMLVLMMERLTPHLAAESEHYQQVLRWVEQLCQKENIEEVNLSKSLLNLLISMTSRVKNCLPIIRDVAQDLHSVHGDIDQEVEMEETSNYSVVNSKTANSVFMLTLARIEQEVDDVEWVVNKMRVDLIAIQEKSQIECTQDHASREGRERSVCLRLGSLINALHELVQTALPLGPGCDTLIKQLHKLYTSLTNLNKYYLYVYTKSLGALLPKFEKLVKLTGTHLTQHVYALITYMQASQTELLQNMEQKKKGEKKKADQPVKKAQVVKEGKAVPGLIFSIEEYEKFLIQLSKKSKINLMEHVKNSTNRDFRINTAALQALDEDSDAGSDVDQANVENEAPDENENENRETQTNQNVEKTQDEPVAKKAKLTQKSRLGKKAKS